MSLNERLFSDSRQFMYIYGIDYTYDYTFLYMRRQMMDSGRGIKDIRVQFDLYKVIVIRCVKASH